MILYPFPPGSALKCGIAGFDEEKREPAAELYLLSLIHISEPTRP